MKRYLLAEGRITFPMAYEVSSDNFIINGSVVYKHVPIPGIDTGHNNGNEELRLINLYIGMQLEQEEQQGILKGYVKVEGKSLQILRERSRGTATVDILMDFHDSGREREPLICRIVAEDMPIVGSTSADYTMMFRTSYFRSWDSESFQCLCSITAKVPNEVPSTREPPKKIPIPQKMLQEEILSDVVLIPGNGAIIKAHKSFLAAHSSVFLAMFQSDMEEARECTVEIPDMTEGGVRALLKYLYYEDMESAEGDSLIAFELFCAGHKYDISELEKLMREMLLKQEDGWFDMDVAVKLFLFARNLIPVNEEVKKKAIQVLKLHLEKLEESPTYQEIFEKDKKAAMELCKYAFAT